MAEPAPTTSEPDRPPIRLPDGTWDYGTVSVDPQNVPGQRQPLTSPLAPGEAAGRAATEYERVSGERQQDEQARLARQDQRFQRLEDYERTHPLPQPPTLQRAGPPPDARQYQQYSMQFMGALAAVVAFSNKKAGVSATDSLNAFAGAMDGWGKGNEQAYQNAAQRWKQATEATLQNNRAAIESYDMIIRNRALNTGEMLEQIKTAAVLNNDHIMYNKARQEDILGVFKLRDMQEKATNDLEAKSRPLMQNYNEREAKRKLAAQEWEPLVMMDFMGPDGQEIRKPDGQPFSEYEKTYAKRLVEKYGSQSDPGHNIPLSDAALDEMVDQRIAGKPKSEILSRLGTGAQGRRDVTRFENRYAERARALNISGEEQTKRDNAYLGERAGQRSVGVMEANLEQVLRNTQKAIPQAIESSEKLPRGTFVPLNKLQQMGEQNISDKRLRAFAIDNLQVAELWARSMNIKGVMRNDDRMLALQNLMTADSHETYLVALGRINKFLNREYDAIKEKQAGQPMKPLDESLFVPKGKGGAPDQDSIGRGGETAPTSGWGVVR